MINSVIVQFRCFVFTGIRNLNSLVYHILLKSISLKIMKVSIFFKNYSYENKSNDMHRKLKRVLKQTMTAFEK